jgi:hypothetical protein
MQTWPIKFWEIWNSTLFYSNGSIKTYLEWLPLVAIIDVKKKGGVKSNLGSS